MLRTEESRPKRRTTPVIMFLTEFIVRLLPCGAGRPVGGWGFQKKTPIVVNRFTPIVSNFISQNPRIRENFTLFE